MRACLAALAIAFGVAATPAVAQVELGAGFSLTGTATATTDYVFRNISQTNNRPAVQGALELSHEIGVYVGAFASNVTFPGTDARQEVTFTAGYRHTIDAFTFDIGAISYNYPGYDRQPGQQEIAFVEAMLRLKVELDPVTLIAAANYSPNFFGRSGDGWWIEGGADVTLPFLDIVLSGRLGYQWIERNARFGTPDYLAYGISATLPIAHGVAVSAGFYGTDISQSECGGLKICDNRFIAALSWTF